MNEVRVEFPMINPIQKSVSLLFFFLLFLFFLFFFLTIVLLVFVGSRFLFAAILFGFPFGGGLFLLLVLLLRIVVLLVFNIVVVIIITLGLAALRPTPTASFSTTWLPHWRTLDSLSRSLHRLESFSRRPSFVTFVLV